MYRIYVCGPRINRSDVRDADHRSGPSDPWTPDHAFLNKNYPRVQPSLCVQGPLDPMTLLEAKPALTGLKTVRAMLNAGWPAHLVTLSFHFSTISDPSWVTS